MKFSAALLLGAPVLFALAMSVAQGCGSPTQGPAPGTGTDPLTGAPVTGGTAGSGSTAPAPSGAPTVDACDPPSADPRCSGINMDASCNTAESSTGAACTGDCLVPCGFDQMGLKICTCLNGVYESCPCARPAEYKGAPTATFCTQGEGMTAEYEEQPCTTEWEQCIARDPVTGTPQGCVCKTNSETSSLEWFCGSTNNWFALESANGDGICEGATPDITCDAVNPDASCISADARTGSSCTIDCRVGCGFQTMGLKYCTCAGGVYASCPCPKPENYLGAPTAPPCSQFASPDGTADALDDLPCTTEWDQCIGSEVSPGSTTPRGCACITNRITNALQWYCGSTNRWFAPE